MGGYFGEKKYIWIKNTIWWVPLWKTVQPSIDTTIIKRKRNVKRRYSLWDKDINFGLKILAVVYRSWMQYTDTSCCSRSTQIFFLKIWQMLASFFIYLPVGYLFNIHILAGWPFDQLARSLAQLEVAASKCDFLASWASDPAGIGGQIDQLAVNWLIQLNWF